MRILTLQTVLMPAVMITVVIIVLKPRVFSMIMQAFDEDKRLADEVGMRLGQGSEFAFIVSRVAESNGLISASAATLINASTLFTLVISAYLVVNTYATPVSVENHDEDD